MSGFVKSVTFIGYISFLIALSLMVDAKSWFGMGGQKEQSPLQNLQKSWNEQPEESWTEWMNPWHDEKIERLKQVPNPWSFLFNPSHLMHESELKFNQLFSGMKTKMTKGFYLAEMDMPGVDSRDVEVKVINDEIRGCRLEIHGFCECEKDPLCSPREYHGTLKLPSDATCPDTMGEKVQVQGIGVDKVAVGLNNGVLRVRVARRGWSEGTSFQEGAQRLREGVMVAVTDGWDWLKDAGIRARDVAEEAVGTGTSLASSATEAVKRAGQQGSESAASLASSATEPVKQGLDDAVKQATDIGATATDRAASATDSVKDAMKDTKSQTVDVPVKE